MQKQMVKNEKVSLEMVNVWMRADETKTEPSGMNTQRYVWRKGGTAHRHENVTAAVNYGGGMNAAIWACFTASGPGQPGLIKETDEFTRVSKTLVRIVPECLRINRTSVVKLGDATDVQLAQFSSTGGQFSAFSSTFEIM